MPHPYQCRAARKRRASDCNPRHNPAPTAPAPSDTLDQHGRSEDEQAAVAAWLEAGKKPARMKQRAARTPRIVRQTIDSDLGKRIQRARTPDLTRAATRHISRGTSREFTEKLLDDFLDEL